MKEESVFLKGKFSNFSVINSLFTRCRCSVFYTGRNRNRTTFPEESVNRFIQRKGYANVPIIGHLYKDEKTGKMRLGSHDEKIVITNEGIDIINECVPFGVVPEDCNPSFDLITEMSGEQRKYFSVDVILWTHRYPELLEAKYSDEVFFNQSMECIFSDDSYFDEDGYFVAKDFDLSALCLLNKSDNMEENVEPCFESSRVKRLGFSLNENEKFKKEFNELLEELKEFNLMKSTSDKTDDDNKNDMKHNVKGEPKMDLTKFTTLLSDLKFPVGEKEFEKYALLGAEGKRLFVLDKEDGKPYAVNYVMVEENPLINWETKTEGKLIYADKTEEEESSNIVSFMTEIEAEKFENKLKEAVSELNEKYSANLSEVTDKFKELKEEYVSAKSRLEAFEEKEREELQKKHDDEIECVLASFEKKIGKHPEFVYYKAKLDVATADVAEITKDLNILVGKISMEDVTGKKANTFSYTPASTKTDANKYASDDLVRAYGGILANYLNK